MSVLEGVLREELARLSANISAYKEKLKNLPKGTIFIRKDYNSYFVYRRRREGSKILSEYIGPLESLRAQEEMNKSSDYKRIKKNLKIANEEYLKLKKVVRIMTNNESRFFEILKVLDKDKSTDVEKLASIIKSTGGNGKVDEKNKKIIHLFAKGDIDYETAVFAIKRNLHNHERSL